MKRLAIVMLMVSLVGAMGIGGWYLAGMSVDIHSIASFVRG